MATPVRRILVPLAAAAAAIALGGCGGSGESGTVTVTVRESTGTAADPATSIVDTSTVEATGTSTAADAPPTTRVERYMQDYEDGQLGQWVEDVGWLGGEIKNVGGEPQVRGVTMMVSTRLAKNTRNRTIAQHICNVSIDAILKEDFADSVAAITVWDKDGYALRECPNKTQPVTLPEPPPPPPPPPPAFSDPTLPNTIAGAKHPCGRTTVDFPWGSYRFDVWVISGDVSCAEAKGAVAGGMDTPGWQYVDWTKGGNGPWSDVWARNDDRDVVAAIVVE